MNPEPPVLPLRPSRRATIVADHARQLRDVRDLTEDERVRIDGVLRALGPVSSGALTRPGVRNASIADAAANDVATIWTRIHGNPPWKTRPFPVSLLDRFWR